MADIASSDVTITVQRKVVAGKRKRNRVKIAFGNGTLTYPNAAGGVPLPAFGNFGFKRFIEFLSITDENDASGIVWKYDQENHKLRGYIPGIVVGAAGAATLDDFPADTTADPLMTAVSYSLTNNTGAGTKYLGAQKELAAAAAPAAQVLYAEAVGW